MWNGQCLYRGDNGEIECQIWAFKKHAGPSKAGIVSYTTMQLVVAKSQIKLKLMLIVNSLLPIKEIYTTSFCNSTGPFQAQYLNMGATFPVCCVDNL